MIEVIRKYYEQIKDIFVRAAVEGGQPPDMRKREFAMFCETAKIPDRNIHTGLIDTYFKATNFEEFDMEGNDDNALCRFEFFEMIVRLAKGKFMDFGNIKTLDIATEKIIVEHVLPTDSKLVPWKRFR